MARNGDEFKAVVYLANSLVRALVTNAKAEVREKLLSQFEAWFRFLLDAQEGHSGEQGGDSIMIHEVTTRTTLIRAREEEAKNIVLRVAGLIVSLKRPPKYAPKSPPIFLQQHFRLKFNRGAQMCAQICAQMGT